ncbi:hypothetical protein ARMGADRAFT_147856 [Armillaria gallica]|uniref:Uncharacterized protein n=1 Tax=Armillaria gallica TaxID=47427 RepID=A0A2H3DG71_ARMGA|nr:hypothetical protein ARMGADRAFT_147856 [Armillaria gallica]
MDPDFAQSKHQAWNLTTKCGGSRPPARLSLLQLPAPAPQILDLVGMGMTHPIMRNWAHLENVCAAFDLEIQPSSSARFSQPHPIHTRLSFSPGPTSACQFRYMDLEREAVTNTELRGEYQLVASQIWRSAISRHILLIRLRCWSDITTLSLGSKKPHSNKSQPNTEGDYARMRSTVETAHAHILPVAPRIPDPSIIIHCRTQRFRPKRREQASGLRGRKSRATGGGLLSPRPPADSSDLCDSLQRTPNS